MKRSRIPKATAVIIGPDGVKPLVFDVLSVESIGHGECVDLLGSDSPRRENIPDDAPALRRPN